MRSKLLSTGGGIRLFLGRRLRFLLLSILLGLLSDLLGNIDNVDVYSFIVVVVLSVTAVADP